MQKLYEKFLDCNYTPELFYRLSVNEAIDMIDSHSRRQINREKKLFQQGIAILDLFGSNFISKLFMAAQGENYSAASMVKLLPELFAPAMEESSNERAEENQTKLSGEMQLYKAQRIQHAYRMNQQRKGKSENEK